jgi:hypothetical protein
MKSKISYSEKSSIDLIILAITFIFEEDLVKYELAYARYVISKFFPLWFNLDLQFQLTLSNENPPQINMYLAMTESFIFIEHLPVSVSEWTWKN